MVEQQLRVIEEKIVRTRSREVDNTQYIMLLAQRHGIVYELNLIQKSQEFLKLTVDSEYTTWKELEEKAKQLNRKIISINRKLKNL